MRFHLILSCICALILTSCANQGVIVRKNSGPMPFYESLGIDGSYKFALRDNNGAVHSQLVTPEVFQGYSEGDYFNDLQPAPSQHATSAAAKGTAAIQPMTGQGLAKGNSFGANRFAMNTRGAGHSAVPMKTHPTSSTHLVASAHKAPTIPLTPKAQSPVVSAHFTVGVPPPAPVTASVEKSNVSSSSAAVASKTQTAPTAHSVALMTRQDSEVRDPAAKPVTAQAASSTASKPKVATSSKPAPKKDVKRPAAKAHKTEAVDPSRAAYRATSAQIQRVH